MRAVRAAAASDDASGYAEAARSGLYARLGRLLRGLAAMPLAAPLRPAATATAPAIAPVTETTATASTGCSCR